MVDAMVQAVTYLMPRSWGWENTEARRKAAAEPTTNKELFAHEMRKKVQEKIEAQARQKWDPRQSQFPGY